MALRRQFDRTARFSATFPAYLATAYRTLPHLQLTPAFYALLQRTIFLDKIVRRT
jgi:hypothetical protein